MKTVLPITRLLLPTILALTSFVASIVAQEVSIPDPGLNAAIRAALQKPNGPLTEQDLLSLTELRACCRNIGSVEGLGAARNLTVLDLQSNRLVNLTIPGGLTKLNRIELNANQLTNLALPAGMTNLDWLLLTSNQLTNVSLPADLRKLSVLGIEDNRLSSLELSPNLTALAHLGLRINQLTGFTLPASLTNLQNLSLDHNQLTNFSLPASLSGLHSLVLDNNRLTNVTLPAGLTNLSTLALDGNQLTRLTLPPELTKLSLLRVSANQLTDLAMPADMTNLHSLYLKANGLTNLTLPQSLTGLVVLDLSSNQFTRLNLPSSLNRLFLCDLSANQLVSFTFPAGMTELNDLNLQGNQLRSCTLPAGLTNLHFLNLNENQLTNLNLPAGLNQLGILRASGNQLAKLTLPAGLTNLFAVFLTDNQLTSLTLPPDMTQLFVLSVNDNQLTNLTLPPGMTQLIALSIEDNPLMTFVLSEPLAATTNLVPLVAALRNQGVSVFTYPLEIQLVSSRQTATTDFEFTLTGPPGIYAVLSSTNLTAWSELAGVTNQVGSAVFTDANTSLSPEKFFHARRQNPPTNMVFIPPNTFTMGSPINDPGRGSNEGPQTTVTLTGGFWIGKYEVTQGEFLSLMNTNPSEFPGDLSRPVSSVTWLDATNYCAKLTLRELSAGRISTGSQYRLPTEAEWECAARAGTSTRFSYGDDPDYTSLTNYAWFLDLAIIELTVRPVGQKLPNPWGLYDVHGNVWEWCQDWYGPLPGGGQTDPTGPASNPWGDKVMRGGAFDYPDSSCRSASRLFFPANPFRNDWNLGFRVVLVTGPQ